MSLGNQLRVMNLSSGLRTEFGTLLPPGAQVAAYVRSTGPQSGEDLDIRQKILPTLNQAAARCRPGAGDVIYVLNNHVENIATADQISNLVAGTKIIGCGSGVTRPTFTWTAAGSTFLLDVADVEISNCILNLDPGTGTVNVAAPITISAAGCAIKGCQIRMGTDANSKVTIGLTTTAAADDCVIADNFIFGATAAECTTMIRLVGADRLRFTGNSVIGATSVVTIGCLQFITTDSLDVLMVGNKIRNNKAVSSAAVTVSAGATSSSGFVDELHLAVLENTTTNNAIIGNAAGAWSASGAAFVFGFNVAMTNLVGERALQLTPASA